MFTSCRQDREVNASAEALVRDHQRAEPITLHRLHLVVLAPVDIGSPGLAGAVDDMRGLDVIEHLADGGLLVHAGRGAVHPLALLLEELDQEAPNPASGSPDEECRCRHGVLWLRGTVVEIGLNDFE